MGGLGPGPPGPPLKSGPGRCPASTASYVYQVFDQSHTAGVLHEPPSLHPCPPTPSAHSSRIRAVGNRLLTLASACKCDYLPSLHLTLTVSGHCSLAYNTIHRQISCFCVHKPLTLDGLIIYKRNCVYPFVSKMTIKI